MESQEIEVKVKEIFSLLFDVEPQEIGPETSTDTLENWDSMQHLNLITSLESEFGISLEEDRVVEMLNFAAVMSTVKELI